MIPRVSDRRVVTYGFSPQADVRGINVETIDDGCRYDVVLTDRKTGEKRTVERVRLPMLGAHNVQNSLAVFAIASEMGLDDAVARRALGDFKGVKRRFTKTGEADGITIIDDYGHHPVEIGAVLKAARSAAKGQVIAVVQPHRYSRLRDLFNHFCTCFNEADVVVVADVYAAGEAPLEGIDRDALIEGLRASGHRSVVALAGPAELAATIDGLARSGDMVVCLGAGTITAWANALPEELATLRESKKRVGE